MSSEKEQKAKKLVLDLAIFTLVIVTRKKVAEKAKINKTSEDNKNNKNSKYIRLNLA